jgi:short-subunit dehydrogenase
MPITTTVITGATSGIGKETAIALAKKGHAVYMLVRDTEKGEQVKQQIIKATKAVIWPICKACARLPRF